MEDTKVYWVTIYTADHPNSGTEAEVFFQIKGDKGETEKIIPKQNNDNFNRGCIDKFEVKSKNLGTLNSLTIGHNNKSKNLFNFFGIGNGWFLDKVLVEEGKELYEFPCARWLDDSKDDKKLIRELPLAKSVKRIEYKVKVTTANENNAGTDSDVSICLIGDKGETGQRTLDSDKDDFERGKTDLFRVLSEDIGVISKIRVQCSGKSFICIADSWKCKRIVIEDPLKVNYTFEIDQWFDADNPVREFSIDSSQITQSGISYTIETITADIKGAATSSQVYIILYGDKNKSGKMILENSPNNFSKGQTDKFTVECEDLGNITQITIGHNNTGYSPDWYLATVTIKNDISNNVWRFPCGKWFSSTQEDKLIERDLLPSDQPVQIVSSESYKIEVITGDRRGAGTDANVFIELYGDKSSSGPRTLEGKGNCFERKQTDIFGIQTSDLGKLIKIRIGHDNSGFGAAWFLDKVVITQQSTNEQFFFPCGDWLEKNKCVREIASLDKDGNPSLPLVSYKIEVTTGDRRGAGTDANVFCVLFGTLGDSGQKFLDAPGNCFERNKTDVFGIETVDLGELKKILIGHDNSGFGPGWFLDKVVVTNNTNKKQWFFLVGKWFAKDEEDKQIEREVSASDADGQPCEPLVTYKVSVRTGDRRGAGTDANVRITIFGTLGNSGSRILEGTGNLFERNQEDVFGIKCVNLGELSRISIGHDNSGAGPAWFLDKVIIQSGKGEVWFFRCGRWLAKDEDDHQITREIFAEKADAPTYTPLSVYQLKVITGDCFGAGTDGSVYVTLIGSDDQSQEILLESTKDCFKRKSTDEFSISTPLLGKLVKIRVRLGGGIMGDSWFMDKILVYSEFDKSTTYFLYGNWIGSKNKVAEISGSGADGKTYAPTITYKVAVTTGKCRGAGTDATVFIILYGANGNSGKRTLEGSSFHNLFERGNTDNFELSIIDLGELKQIRIGHNGKGFGAGWFCDKVYIEASTGGKWNFPCQKWFDSSVEDKQIERDLAVDGKPGRPVVLYCITVITGTRNNSGTDANVYISLVGKEGRVDKFRLDNSKNNFEKGQIDVFPLETYDLGDLKEVIIEHDNSGVGPGWYLDKIFINNEKQRWVFLCDNWLDKMEGDKQISRVLKPGSGNRTTYVTRVYTGKDKGGGTDANITILLVGSKGKSEIMKLSTSDKKNKFETGKIDTFALDCTDLGQLNTITLYSDGKGAGADWKVDKVEIIDQATSTLYRFVSNSWLKKGELTLKLTDSGKSQKLVDETDTPQVK